MAIFSAFFLFEIREPEVDDQIVLKNLIKIDGRFNQLRDTTLNVNQDTKEFYLAYFDDNSRIFKYLDFNDSIPSNLNTDYWNNSLYRKLDNENLARLADLSIPQAEFILGIRYLKGSGLKKDSVKGYQYLARSFNSFTIDLEKYRGVVESSSEGDVKNLVPAYKFNEVKAISTNGQ